MKIEKLHQRILENRKKEKQILAAILRDLYQIYRTRYYAKLGHDSLFKYLVKELHYSEGAAARRVQALKICQAQPEIRGLVGDARMSLRNFALLGKSLPKVEAREKKNLVAKAVAMSSREFEKEVMALDKEETPKRESLRRVSSQRFRLSVNLSEKGKKNLDQIKGLHRNRGKETSQILEEALELYLQQNSPQFSKARTRKTKHKSLTKALKAQVWSRAQGKCQYPRCGSTHLLEVEHIHPRAKGGSNNPENLALFCRTHNTLSAIEAYGLKQMELFLKA